MSEGGLSTHALLAWACTHLWACFDQDIQQGHINDRSIAAQRVEGSTGGFFAQIVGLK